MTETDPDTGTAWFLGAQRIEAPALVPALYIVATPIGNLGDITLRALNVLAAASMIACEDTRTSRVLLQRYGIDRKLVPYHEHNAKEMLPRILGWLATGQSIALVSDAGTPLISDPGYRLVGAVLEAGFAVESVPGPSAVITALAAAGLPTDAFFFAGFLPAKSGERRARLAELAQVPGTLVFYESPHRIAEALADAVAVYGAGREAVLARELTKMFQEFRRLPLGQLLASVEADAPRGEIVLLVGPPAADVTSASDIDAMIVAALGAKSLGKAAADIAKMTGRPKKEIYARALQLGRAADSQEE